MITSVIRDIIGQFNSKGIRPTCQDIATELAKQTGQQIGTVDLKDKLDDMEAAEMIRNDDGCYSLNPTSKL